MRKVYKNELYRIIKEEFNLDPNKFTLYDYSEESHPISEIRVFETDMKFIFANTPSSWEEFKYRSTLFTPQLKLGSWKPLDFNYKSFIRYDDVIKEFKNWISIGAKPFLEEFETIDKWKYFQFEANIFDLTGANFGQNDKFTMEEVNNISNSIDKLKRLLIDKFEPNPDQLEFLEERLEYIYNATLKQGKFDWSNTFIAIIISIAINMGVDTTTGKEFFDLIKIAFGSLKYLLNP